MMSRRPALSAARQPPITHLAHGLWRAASVTNHHGRWVATAEGGALVDVPQWHRCDFGVMSLNGLAADDQ